MNSLPPDLKTHVDGAVTSLCHAWTVRRSDGVALGFTDHDETLTLDGLAHDPQTGFNASAAEAALGMQPGSMELDGALRSDRISEADIRAGKYDGAWVETWLVNWQSPADRVLLRNARIGQIDIEGQAFKVELQSLAAPLERRHGRLVRRRCDAALGDQRCQVDTAAAPFTGAGAVSQAGGQADFRATGLAAHVSGWFEHGELTWLTGGNAGVRSRIALHETGATDARLSLWLPLASPPAAGDAFTIVAGCDKLFATCKEKFGNALNFQGFPHLPGNDAVYSYVNGKGNFDGGALVP